MTLWEFKMLLLWQEGLICSVCECVLTTNEEIEFYMCSNCLETQYLEETV